MDCLLGLRGWGGGGVGAKSTPRLPALPPPLNTWVPFLKNPQIYQQNRIFVHHRKKHRDETVREFFDLLSKSELFTRFTGGLQRSVNQNFQYRLGWNLSFTILLQGLQKYIYIGKKLFFSISR